MNKKKNTPEIKIENERFILMPKGIVVAPRPFEDLKEEKKTTPPITPSSGTQKAPENKKLTPENSLPEQKMTRRVVFFVGVVMLSTVFAGAGIAWWYRKNPVVVEKPQIITAPITRNDIGLSIEARDLQGRTLGILKVRIPSNSLPQETPEYRAETTTLPDAFFGGYVLSPQGAMFTGPIGLTISYFETDIPQGKLESDLRVLELTPTGPVIFGKSVVEVNRNEVLIESNRFPNGPIYLGFAKKKDITLSPPGSLFPSITTDPLLNQLESGFDRDNDGLSDREEILWNADVNKWDTDGDGYEDGREIRNGYAPDNYAPARLLTSSAAREVADVAANVAFTIPKKANVDAFEDGDTRVVVFTFPDSQEFMQFTVSKITQPTIAQWFAAIGGDIRSMREWRYRGFPAIRSLDGSTFYWREGDSAFGWRYQPAEGTIGHYLSTWEIAQRSQRTLRGEEISALSVNQTTTNELSEEKGVVGDTTISGQPDEGLSQENITEDSKTTLDKNKNEAETINNGEVSPS